MTYFASLITNLMIQATCKKGTKLTDPLKFLPPWVKEPQKDVVQQSPEDMKSILMTIASEQNKKIKRGGMK